MSKYHANIAFFYGTIYKILAILLFLIFTMTCTGCSGKSNINSTNQEQTPILEVAPCLPSETPSPKLSMSDVSILSDMAIINEVDYSSYFEGRNGCAVFFNPSNNQYDIYNLSMADLQRSPCSTFKIISSLLGLESGVIDWKNSTKAWSGEKFWMPKWNQDIDFLAAFRSSCVWYFRQVIDDLGKDTIQKGLDILDYGNRDISDWEGRLNTNNDNRVLTGFWIESSLKISPKQQTEVMARIFEPAGAFSEDTTVQLKEVMHVAQTVCGNEIYGKTGSGKDNNVWVDAWFVGMIEREAGNIYFASYLGESAPYEISSKLAKEIVIEIASDFYND